MKGHGLMQKNYAHCWEGDEADISVQPTGYLLPWSSEPPWFTKIVTGWESQDNFLCWT